MNNIHLHVIGSEPLSNLLKELNFNYNISSNKNLKYNNKDTFVRVIFVEQLQTTEIKSYFLEINNKFCGLFNVCLFCF